MVYRWNPVLGLLAWPTTPFQDPVMIVALVLALVLALPLLGRILRIPDIILLILAGMLFGENGLGLLERDQAMEVWGAIGLIYIMFLAGLEINVQDFIRNRNRSLVVGLLSFAIPQVVGTLAAVLLLDFGWTKAILLASMLASFTLLTYPQISRLGLARKEAVSVTVGGTLITDTLALLVLAVIVDMHGQAFSWLFILRLTFSFTVFLAVILGGVPLLGRWFFRRVGRDGGAQFLFVLLIAFLAGALSHLAGVEPIIGAFLAGVTLNRLVPPQSALMNRIEFIGRNLFIPFFLLAVGMIVDPAIFLADRNTWKVGTVMVGAVFTTKYAASIAAQRILGYTRDEGMVIFGLTVTQAAATLAAVVVGYRLEIFDTAVLNGTLMMILATCMVSPWVTDIFGRRMALQQPSGEGNGHTSESGRILIPVDNPATAERMMELAILLRPTAGQEPLLPLRVVTSESEVVTDVVANERMLFGAIAQAAAGDVPATPLIRVAAGVSEGIRRAAMELRASTVLLGWTQHSVVGSAVFGGIFDDVLDACRMRVVACRLNAPLNTIRRTLLVVPPNAEREAGFTETLQLVWRLNHQIGAALAVLCADANREQVRRTVKALKPEHEIEWLPTGTWADVRRALPTAPGADTLRVLLTAREGGLSWRPGLDRLPRAMLAGNRGVGNVLLIYPAMTPDEEEDRCSLPPAQSLADLVMLGGVRRADPAEDGTTAFTTLLQPFFSGDPHVFEHMRNVVLRAAADFPIELAKDVVLVHAHTSSLQTPRLFVLVHPAGLTLAETHARVVLVLLGPEGGPPDRHLQVLSALARFVRNATWVAAVVAAPDETALRGALTHPVGG